MALTVEEVLASGGTIESETEGIVTVDLDTREMELPECYEFLGVESDEKVKRVFFYFPRYTGNSYDLTSGNVYINYLNAAGNTNRYIVDDLIYNDEYVAFSWLTYRSVFEEDGKVYFSVCAKLVDDDGEVEQEWNTIPAVSEVGEGLEATAEAEDEDLDAIAQLLTLATAYEGNAETYATAAAASAAEAAAYSAVSAGELVLAQTGANLLADGSFLAEDYWAANMPDGMSLDTDDPHSGERCLATTASGMLYLNHDYGGGCKTPVTIAVEPDATYILSGWCKVSEDAEFDASNTKLRIGSADGNNTLLATAAASADYTEWTKVSTTWTNSGGCTTVYLMVAQGVTAGTVYWDDIRFELASTAAGTAVTHTANTAVGDATRPVYVAANGTATATITNAKTAIGYGASASGNYATAYGNAAAASSNYTTALGRAAVASSSGTTAVGTNASASGNWSTALGYLANAADDYSTALGQNAISNGAYTTALGHSSIASEANATAIGRSASAALGATALGRGATAAGNYATALGGSAAASGDFATAIGRNAATSGSYSVALGTGASAEAGYATALGTNSIANATFSTAVGRMAIAAANSATALGRAANAVGDNSTALGQGANAATDYSTAVGALANATGNYSTAVGALSSASADYTVALGQNATANGAYATALGHSSIASADNATAIGRSANAGAGGAALGRNADAGGGYSTALGYEANASAANSIAIGDAASAANVNATGSIAIGDAASAGANYAMAIGCISSANKACTTAIGYGAVAAGNYSAALGFSAATNSVSSTALGQSATASGDYSVALGYNAVCANANGIQLGNASTLSTLTCRVDLTVTSDVRDKTDIEELESATEFLNSIHAIRYVLNEREKYIDTANLTEEDEENLAKYGMCTYDTEAHEAGEKKGSRIRAGVSAQEVQEALQTIYGSSDYANLVNDNLYDFADVPDGVESRLAVNYSGFVPFLIKGFQELAARIDKLEETA